MSARAHATPSAAVLVAHLNLLLMVVGGACLWHGAAMLGQSPLGGLDGQRELDKLRKLCDLGELGDRGKLGDLGELCDLVKLGDLLGRVWTAAGGTLVALGMAHWLLAHLALAATIRLSSGLFITYASLVMTLCCAEAGGLAWAVTTLRSVRSLPDMWTSFDEVCLVFSLFMPGNQKRLERAAQEKPSAVYLTLGAALALPLLQLASWVAALCASRGCRRAARKHHQPHHPHPASRHQGRESFEFHRYGDASAPSQYQ